nr:tigger transposable element-derived protein 6-like [Rhipicephalus microplus]
MGVAPSTVATILKDRQNILELHRGSQLAPSRKRLRLGNFQEVDAAVLTWFKDARSQNVPVSGPMLQEKARQFADALDITGFEASAGWLHRFRERNGITWQVVSGEEKAADAASAAAWRDEKFREIIASYSEDDIFNADEMAFFYQMLPDKTMHFKGNSCKGGKQSKVRITVLLCCNSTGTKKLKPLVIGKYKKPRCMRNVVSLPCDYRANSRVWMTRELFSEWLLKVDDEMRSAGRKILIIADNCSAHLVNVRLTNVQLEFLPSNCTSLLQPLDQGIIKSVKAHYRTRLVQRLLINLRMKLPTSINVRQATEMVTGAWWSVTSTTIQNCWRKAGLVVMPSESEQGSEESDASGMWQEVVERLAMDASVTFEDYVQCDDEACTSAKLTTDDIVSAVRGDNSDKDANGEDDAETAPVSQPEESLSNADIMECVRKMRTYLGRCSNATEAEHKNVDNFEAFVLRQLSGTRQAKITDFFK